MSYSKLILRDSAEIVWPLDDITESSSVSKAINFFTTNAYSYSASINTQHTNILYNPIVFGGGTLLSFTSSAIGLSIPALGRFSELFENKESTLSLWFQSDKLFTQEYPIFKKRGFSNIGLFIKDNYFIFRYGTSASYSEVAADIVDIKEPTHIVVSRTVSGLNIIINGISYTTSSLNINLQKDSLFSQNDYLDFYGPPHGSWNIDCIAIYPNAINTSIAKRHYVYGLGKTVTDDVFYSRGGNLYNMSTIATERLCDINWDYRDEWNIKELYDLSIDNNGIKPIMYSYPKLYSFDNNLNKTSNTLSFHISASNTQASYVEIDKLYNKIGGGEYPVFLQIKLDGQLPDQYLSQRLLSYGKFPENEILKFDLYNDGGIYKVRATATYSSSVAFNISNITASPTIYLGMRFAGSTEIYFCESGSVIQTASFSYLDNNGYGLDPLVSYFPPAPDTAIRIGSSLNYNESSFTDYVYGVEQFYGTIKKFFITQPDFISASIIYSDLESYTKSRYELNYDSNKDRFKVKTYGYGSFILHSINFTENIDDDEQIIGANIVRIGYPDIQSSSQVLVYVTHNDYNGNNLYPKTKINQNNYLDFLNNKNIANSYLIFDFEIYSADSILYPPRIQYFQMQTFKSNNGSVIMRDDAGPKYTLYPSASVIYLPEIRYTPTTFMTSNSGIKLLKTFADFTENILPKPLDPRTINGLKLWLDARFINGLNNINPDDDTRLQIWKDLSGNNNHAIQNTSASAPIFRAQSLNLLRSNQLNGTDTGNIDFILSTNATIKSSVEGFIDGTRGIEIIPNESSIDSYIDVSFNTASISVFPNQSYSVVGSIKLNKPQTASALHNNARKIVINTIENGIEIFSASSFASPNIRGTYSLSAVFTTSSATTGARLRFYNGSYSARDNLYWDNLGLYPITASSSYYSWVLPLTLNDHPVIKFDGKNTFMQSSASATQAYSLYVVGRNFNDGAFIGYSASGASIFTDGGIYYINSGSSIPQISTNKEFNVYSMLTNSSSAEFFMNGLRWYKGYSGNYNINNILIGKGKIINNSFKHLSGDIAAVLIFDEYHEYQVRSAIENWLDESFNLIHNIFGQTPLNDIYIDPYTERYLNE